MIRYAYLWRSEFEQGREDAGKDRPCAIILTTVNEAEETIVTVLPITHSAPQHPEDAVEIPYAAKRRLGLDDDRSWIVVSELNRFVWPGSDLRQVPLTSAGQFDYGLLPPVLYRTVRERFLACARAQRIKPVLRTE